MKRIVAVVSAVLVACCSMSVIAAPPGQIGSGLQKSVQGQEIDYRTYIDANELLMFVTNVGSFAYDNGAIFGKADGLYYPRGTNLTVVYAAGLWLGAKVGGDLRVSLAEYRHTYVPGPMAAGTFQPDNPSFKVYKIYKSLKDMGFYDDPRPDFDPILQEAWDDYHDWPAADGAPTDPLGNPKIIGEQTLWCVFNDADPAVHTNSAGSAQGLGVEVQQTVFAFVPFEPDDPLGRCIFMRYLIINKGGGTLNEMYIAPWADPDVGDASDDFVGCRPELDVGYSYNATNNDANYGSDPPAVGFDLLRGPVVPSPGDTAIFLGNRLPGYRNLPMTAFLKYINGTDPDNAQESYWYMQGLDAKNSGAPIIDPTNGEVTTFMCAGLPGVDSGWVDSNPADRRMMCPSGPLDMIPGDTQEVWVAVIVGQGEDHIASIYDLLITDRAVQSLFERGFEICNCMKMGDLNMNGIQWDIADLVYMINYAFRGGPEPPSDPDCPLINRADFNCDDRINLLDIVLTARYIYSYPSVPPCDPCRE